MNSSGVVLIKRKDYTLSEVIPEVFLMNFKDQYKMTMHFLRYSEYQESASPKFRGKQFTILEFMEWYSKKYGKGAFTYPKDWVGYNIPSTVIEEVNTTGGSIKDRNYYDDVMATIFDICSQANNYKKFYLIGSVGVDRQSAIRHEIAHGLFCLNEDYNRVMTRLVKNLKPSLRKKINAELSNFGYASRVFIDETQAYMATGLSSSSKIKLNGEQKPFQKTFRTYYKKSIDSMKARS